MTTLTIRTPALLLLSAALAACTTQVADTPRDAQPSRGSQAVPAATSIPATVMPAPSAAAPAAPMVGAAVQPGAGAMTPPAAGGVSITPAAAAANTAAQDRAVELLRRVERTASGIRTLQADFVQQMDVPLLNQHQESRGVMYQRRPDRFLMRFTQPAGDIMVSDGRYFWIYYPSADRTQVIRTSVQNGAGQVDLQRQFLGNATTRFVPTMNGEATVDGHSTWVMTLVPKKDVGYKILKIWVDKESNLVRRFEMTEENDSVRRVELRNLRINGAVDDDLFTFTPPAGTQIFDQ